MNELDAASVAILVVVAVLYLVIRRLKTGAVCSSCPAMKIVKEKAKKELK